MALIWCDGFDHYGTTPNGGRNAMLAGPWAEFGGNASTIPRVVAGGRTGATSLSIPESGAQGVASQSLARRLFGANKTTVGFGFGLFMANIPAANNREGFQLRNDANGAVLTFALQSDASIEVFRGTVAGTSLGRSGQVLTAAAWNHVEVRAHRDASAGAVEIRVNGVTILDLVNINTGSTDFAGLMLGGIVTSTTVEHYPWFVDDLFAWDTSGANNNDFIGPQRVYTLFPEDDTAQADWVPDSGVTGYTQIDEVPPDADTTYIEAADPADVSEFDLEDLPAEVSAVSALQIVSMLRKTDAGTANVQASLVSSAVGSPPAPAVANGADRPITEVYTYWPDIIENDPATGAPWAASAVNAAKLRLEKTA